MSWRVRAIFFPNAGNDHPFLHLLRTHTLAGCPTICFLLNQRGYPRTSSQVSACPLVQARGGAGSRTAGFCLRLHLIRPASHC